MAGQILGELCVVFIAGCIVSLVILFAVIFIMCCEAPPDYKIWIPDKEDMENDRDEIPT